MKLETEDIKKINYKFTRNILSRAILKNPYLFYEKNISQGYISFVNSLKTAWKNTAKGILDKEIPLSDIEISLELTHVYPNGDFILLVSLPYIKEGCDLIAFYIRETVEGLKDLDGDNLEQIDINYYLFYKTTHVDKYTLLEVDKENNLRNKGYISASEELLLNKLYNQKKKKHCHAKL